MRSEQDATREALWREWVAARPPAVRAVAERFPPWVPVRVKSTGQKAWVYSFGEPDDPARPITLTVNVLHSENPGSLHELLLGGDAVQVFGLAPDDLEPWAGHRVLGETP